MSNPRSGYRVSMRGGRWKYFQTLDQATAYANDVYQRTGVLVAVEATRNPRRSRNGQPEVSELFIMMNSTTEPQIRNQYDSIVKNLAKKIQKGTYDSSKAPKIWFYLANTAAQIYTKRHDVPGRSGSYGIFTVADRKAAAERMHRQFESETKIEIRPAKQNPARSGFRRVRRHLGGLGRRVRRSRARRRY